MKPPTTVRVIGPGWVAVIEVDWIFGEAANIAARLRHEGLEAKRKGDEVHVTAK